MKKFLVKLLRGPLLVIVIFACTLVFFATFAETRDILYSLITMSIACIGVIIAYLLLKFTILFFNFYTKKQIQLSKLNKDDFWKGEEYYRDIIDNYSPMLLAYLDKMEFDIELSIIATLLNLQRKGYIELGEEKINILDEDYLALSKSEKYILSNVIDGKLILKENDTILTNIVFEEGIEKGILDKKSNISISEKVNLNINKIQFTVFMLLSFLAVMLSYFLNNVVSYILKSILLIMIFSPFIFSIYSENYEKNPYKRTKKGEDLNKTIESLKLFLKDYTMMSERESAEITLWKDYLIYSVIFKQNSKVLAECKKYYELKYIMI